MVINYVVLFVVVVVSNGSLIIRKGESTSMETDLSLSLSLYIYIYNSRL